MRKHQNMKRTVAGMAAGVLLCLAQPLMGQLVGRMDLLPGSNFTPRGKQAATVKEEYKEKGYLPEAGTPVEGYQWKLRAEIDIPAYKFTFNSFTSADSSRTFDYMAGSTFIGIGGGIEINRVLWHKPKNPKDDTALIPTSVISWSPLTLYLSQREKTETTPANIDFALASTVGFYNNLFQIGVGRDFGVIDKERNSRWFLSCSIGVTFNK